MKTMRQIHGDLLASAFRVLCCLFLGLCIAVALSGCSYGYRGDRHTFLAGLPMSVGDADNKVELFNGAIVK